MDGDKEALLVFGYSAKLFRDDEKALYIHKNKHLIPWMGDVNLLVDRYDCRGHLSEITAYNSQENEQLTPDEILIKKLCDEERYMALFKDVSLENEQYNEELKRLHLAIAKDDSSYKQIGYQYEEPGQDNDVDDEFTDEKFVPPQQLNVPDGMDIPLTEKQHTIIEMTASFVSKQGPQMEIVMKAKQANNPQFKFMNFDNNLNPYYKHMIKMIKEEGYKPQKFIPQPKTIVNQYSSESEDENYLHPSLFNQTNITVQMNSRPKAEDSVKEINVKNEDIKQNIAENSNIDAYSKLVSQIKQQNDLFKAKEEQMLKLKLIKETMEMPTTSESSIDEDNAAPSLVSHHISNHYSRPKKKIVKKTFYQEYQDYVQSIGYEAPESLQLLINKLIEYVVRNGVVFEREIAAKTEGGVGDSRFAFLADPSNEHFPYYVYELKKYFNAQKRLQEELRNVNQVVDLNEMLSTKTGHVEPTQVPSNPSLSPEAGDRKVALFEVVIRLENSDLRAKERLCRRLHFKRLSGGTPEKNGGGKSTSGLMRHKDTNRHHHHGGPICFSIRNKKSEKSLPFKEVTMLLYQSSSASSDEDHAPENSTNDEKEIDGLDLDVEKIKQAQSVTHNADMGPNTISVTKRASCSTTISVTKNQRSSSPIDFEVIIENDPTEILNRLNDIKALPKITTKSDANSSSTEAHTLRPHPHIDRSVMERSVDVTKSVQAERKKRAALFVKMLKNNKAQPPLNLEDDRTGEDVGEKLICSVDDPSLSEKSDISREMPLDKPECVRQDIFEEGEITEPSSKTDDLLFDQNVEAEDKSIEALNDDETKVESESEASVLNTLVNQDSNFFVADMIESTDEITRPGAFEMTSDESEKLPRDKSHGIKRKKERRKEKKAKKSKTKKRSDVDA